MTKVFGSSMKWTKETDEAAVEAANLALRNEQKNHGRGRYLKPLSGVDRYLEDWDSGLIEGNSMTYSALVAYNSFLFLTTGAGAVLAAGGLIKLISK